MTKKQREGACLVATRDDATTAPARQRLPREVWVLAAANLVIAAGFGIVAPAIPMFARSFDVSVTAASFVVSAFALARLVFAPLAGKGVSLLGERRIYLSGLLIVAVSTGAAAFAASYTQLVLFRSFGGIGSTMFTVSAIALLIRVTPAGLRGRASGLFGAGFLAGNVTGPLLGSGLITISLRAPFLFYAVLLLVATLLVWLLLRRSPLIADVEQQDAPAVRLTDALRDHAYRSALLANFSFGWIVFGVRISLIPLFIVEVLRQDEAFAGIAFAVFAAANLVMLMPAGRLADTVGRKPLVLIGLVASGAGTAWVGFTDSLTEFLIATVVAGLGSGTLQSPKQAAVADVVGSQGRGGPVLATFQMSADIGAILGPLAAGAIADQLSYTTAFLVAGALSLVAALVWLPARETLPSAAKQRHPSPEQSCELDTREQQ
ncbi:MFS transporter [Haloechinothrix sp. LS1_15]|uniref:MFS transporter n=1 Tax=Haloechinothrix sp. LS1_15 TaxID=2652248 RepID=UPI002944EEA0|nr:MFS transporter [Haloechinothrix sp. LS1_15]MDV6011472.1 MFS transporter [Haloechinothrix sp. LS1_15]